MELGLFLINQQKEKNYSSFNCQFNCKYCLFSLQFITNLIHLTAPLSYSFLSLHDVCKTLDVLEGSVSN